MNRKNHLFQFRRRWKNGSQIKGIFPALVKKHLGAKKESIDEEIGFLKKPRDCQKVNLEAEWRRETLNFGEERKIEHERDGKCECVWTRGC